jgi:hypothetical protein
MIGVGVGKPAGVPLNQLVACPAISLVARSCAAIRYRTSIQ